MIPKCKQNNADYQKLKDELNEFFKSFENPPSGDFNENFKMEFTGIIVGAEIFQLNSME